MALTLMATPEDVRAINAQPEFGDGKYITELQVQTWLDTRYNQIYSHLAVRGIAVPFEDDEDCMSVFWGAMKNAAANGAAHDLELSPKQVSAAQAQAAADTYLKQFDDFLTWFDSLTEAQLGGLGLIDLPPTNTIPPGTGFETVEADRSVYGSDFTPWYDRYPFGGLTASKK